MKPNQWCEISTLISQHRKPIIPGATATGPMTVAITKLKLPPSCLLQTTFGPQKPTWIQTKYKLPLDHKSQHGYRPNTNYLWTTEPTWIQARYKLPLGQKSQHGYRSNHTIFGPPRATKESKLTLDLNTEQNLMNSVISTHGLNTSERHRRPSRKLGRTRRQHVTTVQVSIV